MREEDIAVMDVGQELARARERRALSLADLARRTKIPEAALRAIERNDATELPGGIYIRGFLRAYAREVGCEPEQIVARHRTQSGSQELERHETLERIAAIRNTLGDAAQVHSADVDAMDRRHARAERVGAVVLLFAGILYLSLDRHIDPTQPPADPGTINASQLSLSPDALTPVAVGTGGQSGGPVSIADESNGLRLRIQSRGPCWLSATADGRRVVYRLLNAGERADIEAREAVVLRIGDAASLELTINGGAARLPGTAGQAVTIHLTPRNYRAFLNQ